MDMVLDHAEPVAASVGAPLAEARAAGAGLLRFITCGSVDDGKSTLIGRLLYDSKSVFDDQIEALGQDSRRFGTQGDALDLALLVDGLSAEREQGITIDVAYRYFATPRRSFIVADTPGHEQYTRNMATGASTAELAIILIDARKGILPQTRRHSFIVSMLGVRHVAVAINKMDLVQFDRSTFERICADYRAMAKDLGFDDLAFFPISARDGDNVARLSSATPWYQWRTLLDHLESVEIEASPASDALLFPVQWINRPNLDFRGYAGTIARGGLSPGQDILVLPGRQRSRVERIVGGDGDIEAAVEGQSVTLTLRDEIDISRGDVIVPSRSSIEPRRALRARLLWTSETPVVADALYTLKIGTALAQARIEIEQVLNIHSFAPAADKTLGMNGIALASLALDREIVALPYRETRELGGFILIDKRSNETVAFGLVEAQDAVETANHDAIGTAWRAYQLPVLRFFTGRKTTRLDVPQDLTVLAATTLVAAFIVLALTGSPALALAFAIADLLLRPAIRLLCRKIFATARKRSDEFNVDGAGI